MIGALSLERNRKPCGAMGRRHRLMNRLGRALGCAAILFSSSLCQAEIVRQEVSRPRPNEVDTADRGFRTRYAEAACRQERRLSACAHAAAASWTISRSNARGRFVIAPAANGGHHFQEERLAARMAGTRSRP